MSELGPTSEPDTSATEGWMECTLDGNVYFYNTLTGDSAWELPSHILERFSRATAAAAADAGGGRAAAAAHGPREAVPSLRLGAPTRAAAASAAAAAAAAAPDEQQPLRGAAAAAAHDSGGGGEAVKADVVVGGVPPVVPPERSPSTIAREAVHARAAEMMKAAPTLHGVARQDLRSPPGSAASRQNHTTGRAAGNGALVEMSNPLLAAKQAAETRALDSYASSRKPRVQRRTSAQILESSRRASMAVALGNVKLTEHQRGFATLAFFVKRRVTKMRMGHEERTHKILDRQQGWPLHEALQRLFIVRREQVLLEALLFILSCVIFYGITNAIYNTELAFATDDALQRNVFRRFGDPIGPLVNFTLEGTDNVFTLSDMTGVVTWISRVFLPIMYPATLYNGNPLPAGQTGYVNMYYRLCGGVRLRQERVRNDSCAVRRYTHFTSVINGIVQPSFDTLDGSCFDDFQDGVTDQRTPYIGTRGAKYTWQGGMSTLYGNSSFGTSYGEGGYVTDLSPNRTAALAEFQSLVDNSWMDRGTRALAILFNTYNTNTQMASTVKITFEFTVYGRLTTSTRIRSFRINLYTAATDKIRAVFEVVFILSWVFFVVRSLMTARRFYFPMRTYLYSPQNLLDVALLASELSMIIGWASVVASDVRSAFSVNAPQYQDMDALSHVMGLTTDCAAVVGLLRALKMFKYFSLVKALNVLWMTINRAFETLVYFCVSFMIVTSGFAFMGNFLFGSVLAEYHSFASACSTLFRAFLGVFAYNNMKAASPRLLWIFFFLYVGIAVLFVLNMFIAIVTHFFHEVRAYIQFRDLWMRSVPSLSVTIGKGVHRRYRTCFGGRCLRSSAKQPVETKRQELEHKYSEAVKAFNRICAKNGVDLALYLDAYYGGNDHLYVGIHELCTLSSDSPCLPGEHTNCNAFRLVYAYTNTTIATMVGYGTRHAADDSRARGLPHFSVTKVTKYNARVPRVLCVNPHVGHVLLFRGQISRLVKKLTLKRLVLLQRDPMNPIRLSLTFASSPRTANEEIDVVTDDVFEDLWFESVELCEQAVKELHEGAAIAQRLYVGEGGSKGLPKPAEAALADTELVTIKELVEAMEVNVGAMEVVSSSAKLLKKRIREASGRPHAVHGVHA